MMSTQAGLKMIVQCLPESPFKDVSKKIIAEAVEKLDRLEALEAVTEQQDDGYPGWNSLSESEKDRVIRMAT